MRLPALLILISTNAAGGTHCAPTETAAFSCRLTNGKVVSLCLARSPSMKPTALTYRFGRVGAPEFVFPTAPDGSLQRFFHAHYFRYQVDRTEVRFVNAGVEYSLFDYYDGEEKPQRARGVRVGPNEARELLCKGDVVSNLNVLEAVLPCDAESALASCR